MSEQGNAEESERLRLKELELDTQYKFNSLSESFTNLKQFFENFKIYVDTSLHKMDDRVERMRDTLDEFIEKEEARNERMWRRLNVLTFLVMLLIFDVKIDVMDVMSMVLMKFL